MTPDPKTETDRDLDEMNTNILVIARRLKEIFGEDVAFAIMKLEAASRDIHNLRIKHLLNGKINGLQQQ